MDNFLNINADGILYIGDPHATSRRPGGRKDDDFAVVVTNKLIQAFEIANANNAVAVITGDLLNRSFGDNERLITFLLRAFKVAIHKPIVLLGNHDVHDENEESSITDDTTMAILIEADAFISVENPGERIRLISKQANNYCHDILFYPYGCGIPRQIERDEDCNSVSIVSHHDLAFEGAYPGATELFEISGCDLWVNGHMHLTKPPIIKGQTTCYNIGNITRLSRDTINHVPSVWLQDFKSSTTSNPLKPIALNYAKDVFTLSVQKDDTGTSKEIVSSFVELMRVQTALDSEKTEDCSGIKEEMTLIQSELKTPDDAKIILNALVDMLLTENIA